MLNNLPADKFITAAAALSGRDPGDIDAREAVHVLQEYGGEPQGELYRQLTDDAAETLFSDPVKAEEWEEGLAALTDDEARNTDLLAIALQHDLSPIIREKARAMLEAGTGDRAELEKMLKPEPLNLPDRGKSIMAGMKAGDIYRANGLKQKAAREVFSRDKGIMEAMQAVTDAINRVMKAVDVDRLNKVMKGVDVDQLRATFLNNPAFLLYDEIRGDLAPYFEDEIQKPEYDGLTLDELWAEAEESDEGLFTESSRLTRAVDAARAAKRQKELADAQNAGRLLRRKMREGAESKGAIMTLSDGAGLPIFTKAELQEVFWPSRISQIGELPPGAINAETGKVERLQFNEGDIVPLNAGDIPFKNGLLLNAIMANGVENYREFFVSDGTITFYVKGVMDALKLETRGSEDPQQITFEGQALDRKTADVLYIEKQLKPWLSFVGTTPDGSRYSVLNYEGYDIETDTMTVRSPYLFKIWELTQVDYAKRKQARELNPKPTREERRPMEINQLLKAAAYKEDDAVLEIAAYITTVLIKAGRGAHATEIKYKTLIKSCPRLREKLEEIEGQTKAPAGGKRVNTTARYNSTLRKFARAYSLIMNREKCDALENFKFLEFTPTKPKKGYVLPTKTDDSGNRVIDRENIEWEKMDFVPPTKSSLSGKIVIRWRRVGRYYGK